MSEPKTPAEPGTLPRNVCHVCRNLWEMCVCDDEDTGGQCEACVTFSRFRCNMPDECDCPKCQNFCTCEEDSHEPDDGDECDEKGSEGGCSRCEGMGLCQHCGSASPWRCGCNEDDEEEEE